MENLLRLLSIQVTDFKLDKQHLFSELQLLCHFIADMSSADHNIFFFCRGSTKVEDAAELFVRAANSYKMAKKWPGI